jgi:hypothetical protein
LVDSPKKQSKFGRNPHLDENEQINEVEKAPKSIYSTNTGNVLDRFVSKKEGNLNVN